MLKHCIFGFCDGEGILPVKFSEDLFSLCPLKAKKDKIFQETENCEIADYRPGTRTLVSSAGADRI